jgi:hypothetical protein
METDPAAAIDVRALLVGVRALALEVVVGPFPLVDVAVGELHLAEAVFHSVAIVSFVSCFFNGCFVVFRTWSEPNVNTITLFNSFRIKCSLLLPIIFYYI